MKLKAIDWHHTTIWCNASKHRRKRRLAKWYYEGIYYCGNCVKQLRQEMGLGKKQTHKLPTKGYRRNQKTFYQRAKKLRKNATWAEKIFKDKLKKATKLKFQFQKAFIKGGYYAIVDFYIPSKKLCIEIDGEYHDKPSQKSKDEYRDNWLEEVRGQTVIRLTNEQAAKMTAIEIKEFFDI